jgi:hypothetical protein
LICSVSFLISLSFDCTSDRTRLSSLSALRGVVFLVIVVDGTTVLVRDRFVEFVGVVVIDGGSVGDNGCCIMIGAVVSATLSSIVISLLAVVEQFESNEFETVVAVVLRADKVGAGNRKAKS